MDRHSTADRRILRQSTVVELVGVHATTLLRWERLGKFPRRVILGPQSVGWFADEIEAWFATRERLESRGEAEQTDNASTPRT